MTMTNTVYPRGNNLLVRKIKKDDKAGSAGELYVPEINKKYAEGIIVRVGEGRLRPEAGYRTGSEYSTGDHILYTPSFEIEVESDGEELHLIDEDTVIGFVEVTQ